MKRGILGLLIIILLFAVGCTTNTNTSSSSGVSDSSIGETSSSEGLSSSESSSSESSSSESSEEDDFDKIWTDGHWEKAKKGNNHAWLFLFFVSSSHEKTTLLGGIVVTLSGAFATLNEKHSQQNCSYFSEPENRGSSSFPIKFPRKKPPYWVASWWPYRDSNPSLRRERAPS